MSNEHSDSNKPSAPPQERTPFDPHRKCADYASEDPTFVCTPECPAKPEELHSYRVRLYPSQVALVCPKRTNPRSGKIERDWSRVRDLMAREAANKRGSVAEAPASTPKFDRTDLGSVADWVIASGFIAKWDNSSKFFFTERNPLGLALLGEGIKDLEGVALEVKHRLEADAFDDETIRSDSTTELTANVGL